MNTQQDYDISNSILEVKENPSTETKMLYNKMRELVNVSGKDFQELSNKICNDIGVKPKQILYGGVQPHSVNNKGKLKRKTLGSTNNTTLITLFKYTAIKKKVVSTKTTIDTILHEIMHNYDREILNLTRSLHCSGFYYRIGSLQNKLKSI